MTKSQKWYDAQRSQSRRDKARVAAKKPRSQAWKDAQKASQKGRPHTDEHNEALKAAWDKLSPEEKATRAEKWQQAGTQSNIGMQRNKEWFSKLNEEERMEFLKPWIEAGQKGRGSYEPSKLEQIVAKDLVSHGIYIIPQQYIGKYRVDFWLPDLNVVVEVYGCFWHKCEQCNHSKGHEGKTAEQIRQADVKRIAYLKSKGYKVCILWEHDIMKNIFQYTWI